MRIVLDLQGAQCESRHRGIGRYSLSLAKAMLSAGRDHRFIVALNGLFPEGVEAMRDTLDGLIPQADIRVWSAPGPVNAIDPANDWRRHAAELSREAFLSSLDADVVHVSSLFEGFGDDAVVSIGRLAAPHLTAVTFYDAIPLIQRDTYLTPHPVYERLYTEKLAHLRRADLMLAISESSRQEAIRYVHAAPESVVDIAAAVDDGFEPIRITAEREAQLRGRLGLTRPFVMYSGATDERKNHARLIRAFARLPARVRSAHQLAIVGPLPDGHRQAFERLAREAGLGPGEMVLTGRVGERELVELYNLCALFVFPSWHEGFGLPALEAMSCGAAVIASNTTSLPEVVGRSDVLFDPFDEASICAMMGDVLQRPEWLAELRRHGPVQAKTFSWRRSADTALDAMARAQAARRSPRTAVGRHVPAGLLRAIAGLEGAPSDSAPWIPLAEAIARNHPRLATRQLFVDVSEISRGDSRSGVQRVVRAVLVSLLQSPPDGFSIEPVYATPGEVGYRYAREFTDRFTGRGENASAGDELIEPAAGDVFFGLDLQQGMVTEQAAVLRSLRARGVEVHFIVHDLIPITHEWAYPKQWDLATLHASWLDVLAQQDGIICVSRTVADELVQWLDAYGGPRARPLKIGWFHHGADVSQSQPSRGLDPDAQVVLAALAQRKTFLSVGTIEPRKGQRQTLAAFEALWGAGVDVNLVFVGKQGWNGEGWSTEALAAQMKSHPELGRRLFWLSGISDEYLEAIYDASDCLIAASEAEGFGLPVVEAARHGLSVIARDLPVFREVAGDLASYFRGDSPRVIADAVRRWISEVGAARAATALPRTWQSWSQATRQLVSVFLGGHWYRQWRAPQRRRLRVLEGGFDTPVGDRRRRGIASTGREGWLLRGTLNDLEPGKHIVTIRGTVSGSSANSSRVEFTSSTERRILAMAWLAKPTSDLEAVMCRLELVVVDRSPIELRIRVAASSEVEVVQIDVEPIALVTVVERPHSAPRLRSEAPL